MAAGSNWKRPWEDAIPISTIPPPPPQQVGTSSSTSPDSRRLPPIPSNVTSPLSAVHKTALPLKPEPAMEATQRPPVSPLPISTKRPRLGYGYEPASRVFSPNETSLTGFTLLQAVSPPLLEGGSKGPSAAPCSALSDSDLAEYGPGHRLVEPMAIEGGDGGGDASQECEDCKQARPVLRELVAGFQQLRTELLSSMPASFTLPDASIAGVTKSLESISNILHSRGMARRGVMSRSLQTHPNLPTTYGDASRLQATSRPESPQMDTMRRRTLDVEREREDSLKRAQRSSMDEGSRVSESTPSPSLRERRRRSFVSDVTMTVQAHSSVSQSPSSGYFPSPMQAPLPGARAFSSASSSLGNPMLPPISPSSQPPSQAALTAHLSDLQHQVGTKSLALQTLQAEHNHLLSAYSRSQTRCGTLEKKFQVSDTEINNLTEERNRLQLQCDAFEKQVEDLLEQRDTANKLSIANGGQYTSILQQASRLEMQSLSDRKKWRLEKEEWERQKEEMEQRIKQLESEKAEGFAGSRKPHAEDSSELFHKSRSPSAGGLPEHRTDILKLTVVPGDIILSANPDDLRHEIIRLRHKANDLDRTLQELKTEGQRIDQMINGIGTISKRIFAKVDAATTSTTSPGGASTTTADSTQH